VNKNNEAQRLTISATAINLLNQHSVISDWQGFNSIAASSMLFPFQIFQGAPSYQLLESGYDPQAAVNAAAPLSRTPSTEAKICAALAPIFVWA